MLKKLIGLLFVSASAPAMAHLTWIDVGQQSLGLSTGHNFPAKEITVKGEYVDSVRCVGSDGEAFRLPFTDNSIRYVYKERPANCIAILKTSQIELSPRQGAQHFDENKVELNPLKKTVICTTRNLPNSSRCQATLPQFMFTKMASPWCSFPSAWSIPKRQ